MARGSSRRITLLTAALFLAGMFFSISSPANETTAGCNENNINAHLALRDCGIIISRRNTTKERFIQALQIRAKAYLAAGNVNAAISDFTSAIEGLADSRQKAHVLYLRAQSRFSHTRKTKPALNLIIDDLETANNMAPDTPRILEGLAKAYISAGLYTSAMRTATHVLKIAPRTLGAYKVRAAAYERLGQIREAINDLDAVLDLQFHNADILAWRGRLHERRGNAYRALADYRNAARLHSTEDLLAGIGRMKQLLKPD